MPIIYIYIFFKEYNFNLMVEQGIFPSISNGFQNMFTGADVTECLYEKDESTLFTCFFVEQAQ